MNTKPYVNLGDGWKTDEAIKCCKPDGSGEDPSCNCCYDNWNKDLQTVKLEYDKASEQATQLDARYKFVAGERDKFKSWLDDLDKTHLLAKDLCDQLKVVSSQTTKICINSEKSVNAIEILFCMIRDVYEQLDYITDTWNQIDNCIKCLGSEKLVPGSGIMKCLADYKTKLDAVLKTRTDLIKSIMYVLSLAEVLHAEICAKDFGFGDLILEWNASLNCDEKCTGTQKPADPCVDQPGTGGDTAAGDCKLRPVLTLPVCNDPYYAWVKKKYDDDKTEADSLSADLVEANKKKEALAACKDSLTNALKEVNPNDLCK